MSIVILGIIWTYSRKSNLTPSLKNQMFQVCFLVTFIAMATNVISTILLLNYQAFPLWITWIITTIYFIFTPLMALVYVLYSASIIYEDGHKLKLVMSLSVIPAIIYVIVVLINPFTKGIFDITLGNGYTPGHIISITYIIFYAYCLLSVLLVVKNRRLLEPQILKILSVFPIIAVIVIIVQQFYPTIILSGSAATSALLIIYLHLQNKQISMDYLTNIPNRLSLLDMMEILIHTNTAFTVCIISLRDFKQVNDMFGQQNADILLKEISYYLSNNYKQHHVFRFKGDEFALLIKSSNRQEILNILLEIQDHIKQPWIIKNNACLISSVVGVVNYPNSAMTIENLINAVEYAISVAKEDENSNICYCNKEMFTKIQRRKKIIDVLKEKIETKDFDMYYQPIIDLHTKKFHYLESLMRINDSSIGPIYPSEFIPIAEDTGLIIDITYIILDKVCKFVEKLNDNDIDIKAIHVNFSALQFHQTDLVEKVLSVISTYNIPASSIKLEFTESTIAENTKIVTDFAIAMQEHKILMGLDDFGTGYSNLSTVIDIPFNTVKLDKSLVWSAIHQKRSALTIKNLIKMFKDLGMIVIAEGVETKEQNDFIIENSVDQIQGFYYAKPMNDIDTQDFLVKNK